MRDRIEESQSFPVQLEPGRYSRILCFAPHPDDEIQGCGGFFRLATLNGSSVTAVVLTGGDPTGVGTDVQAVREFESIAAAQFIGMKVVFEGLQDRTLRVADWLIDRIAEHIRAVKPDLICLPSPSEMHPDHQAACTATIAAAHRQGYLGDLCFYEAGGVLNQPTHLVVIDEAIEAKGKALACFISQEQHQPYASRIRARDHFRAITLGNKVKFAEALEIFTLTEKDQLKLYAHLQPWQAHARGRAVYRQEVPKITVIIRSSGHPKLQAAVASVLNQTLPPHEILLVHTGQVSASSQWICALSPCIRQLTSPHPLNRAQAANYGLENTNGEYAIFLDDDCYFLPTHLESLVQASEANPNAVGALSQAILVDDRGSHIKVSDYNYLPDRLLFHNIYPSHSILFGMGNVLTRGLKFNERLEIFEDWDFWIQMSRGAILAETGCATCAHTMTNKPNADSPIDSHRREHSEVLANWMGRLGIGVYASAVANLANRVTQLEDERHKISKSMNESEQLIESAQQRLATLVSSGRALEARLAVQSESLRNQQEKHFSEAAADHLQHEKLPSRYAATNTFAAPIRRQAERVFNGFGYLMRRDFQGFYARLKQLSRPKKSAHNELDED